MLSKFFERFKKIQNVQFTRTDNGNISLVIYGKSFTVGTEHPNYQKVCDALDKKDYKDLLRIVDVPLYVTEVTGGKVTFVNGEIYYDGKICSTFLAKKIREHMESFKPYRYLVNFMENVMLNPLESAKQELYQFLEKGNLPITSDGCFLAYKRVDHNFRDYHTGKVDHSVGAKPEMKFSEVDPDRSNLCSRGFHFCSLAYLPSYRAMKAGDGWIIIVKVNPKDVGAIPDDYDNSKGRASTYEVLCVYSKDTDGLTIKPLENHIYDEKGNVLQKQEADKFFTSAEDDDDNDHGDDSQDDDEQDDDIDAEDAEDEESEVEVEGDSEQRMQELVRDLPDAVPEPTVQPVYGVKPSGQRFYNVRGNGGKFVKKG